MFTFILFVNCAPPAHAGGSAQGTGFSGSDFGSVAQGAVAGGVAGSVGVPPLVAGAVGVYIGAMAGLTGDYSDAASAVFVGGVTALIGVGLAPIGAVAVGGALLGIGASVSLGVIVGVAAGSTASGALR